MSELDVLVRTEPGGLGVGPRESSRHHGATGPYRDGGPGASTRRQQVLESRLRELALMPRTAERAFVHRVSRACAGGAALCGVGLMALVSLDPWAHSMVFALVGRLTPPLAAALLGATVLAAYVVGGLVAERVYEHRVRSFFEPSHEAFADSERLAAVSVSDDAARLLHRVDAAAIALPLAGTVSSGLMLGLLGLFGRTRLPPLTLLSESRDIFVPAVMLATIAGIALASACTRATREPQPSRPIRFAEHWSFLAVGAAAALAALWLGTRMAFGLHALGIIPTTAAGVVLGALGLAGLGMPVAWLLMWQRRREHRSLERSVVP